MAAKGDLHRLVGKAVTDANFYRAFAKDPVAAATSEGITLTPEQVTWLQSNPPQLREFLTRTDKALDLSQNCGTCILDGH